MVGDGTAVFAETAGVVESAAAVVVVAPAADDVAVVADAMDTAVGASAAAVVVCVSKDCVSDVPRLCLSLMEYNEIFSSFLPSLPPFVCQSSHHCPHMKFPRWRHILRGACLSFSVSASPAEQLQYGTLPF